MAVVETEQACLREGTPGLWWFDGWGPAWMTAGVVGRSADLAQLQQQLPTMRRLVEAEQVHGGSIAVIHRSLDLAGPVAGCDALLTSLPSIALLMRTADCLPLFLMDPSRRAVGIAHAGWRGLAAGLPLRMLAAFRHAYHSRPEDLRVAIGPSIRSCCYEVGPEFAARFGPFVTLRHGRRTCDLIGVAVDQFRRGGVRPAQIVDCQQCTACDTDPWFSIRREGQATGRLRSFILIR